MAGNSLLLIGETTADGRPTPTTLELNGHAVSLGRASGMAYEVLLLGKGARSAAGEMSRGGAARVYYGEGPPFERYHPEIWAESVRKHVDSHPFDVLIAGHTPAGQDLLPRLAFLLGGSLVTDCVSLSLEAEGEGLSLLCTRPVYGGNALATYALGARPMMATVRRRVGSQVESEGPPAELVPLEAVAVDPRLELGELVAEESEGPRLEEAEVVVAGGRGMGGAEGFAQLRALAELLGGAVGASRPACDAGWAPASLQVGITGMVVAPAAYFAVGISGSSQHLSGMLDSGHVIALNRDPEAEIFKVSTHGAVGEWQQVLPALLGRLRQELEGRDG